MEESLSKSRLGKYALLRHKKYRDERGLFVAEGEKSVFENLGTFAVEALIVTPGWLERHRNDERLNGLTAIYRAEREKMERLSSLSTPPEVIAIFHKPEPLPFPEKLAPGLYLALDGIQDPGNLGTIIRTADWFGIHEVFASEDTVDVYNSKTVQATMGSLSRVRMRYLNLARLLEEHRDLTSYGTLLDGENIYTTPLSRAAIIVMGNEGTGLSSEVRELLDKRLLLPPYDSRAPHAESLNVGVATALIVAEFRRREQYGK